MLVNHYHVLLWVITPVLQATQLPSQLLSALAIPQEELSKPVSLWNLTLIVGTGRTHLHFRTPNIFLGNYTEMTQQLFIDYEWKVMCGIERINFIVLLREKLYL